MLDSPIHYLSLSDDGAAVELAPLNRLRIVLEEIPSTGYSWKIKSSPSWLQASRDSFNDYFADEPLIKQEPTEIKDGLEELAGGAVIRVLELVVDPSGQTEAPAQLLLEKSRSWEASDVAAVERLEVTVSVKA